MRIALTLDRDACEREDNDYLRALEQAGFSREEITVVPPGSEPPGEIDGLVLGGGCDVEPARYGQNEVPGAGVETDPARDATDFALFDLARRGGVPTLAICRGLQVVNVALGGTLVQDLRTQRASAANHEGPDEDKTRLEHAVRIEPETRLRAIAQADEIRVNSRHHQAVARLARGLKMCGQAPDGLVEAVEAVEAEEPWLVAVQWHPENLAADPSSRRLFAEFARAVRSGVLVPER